MNIDGTQVEYIATGNLTNIHCTSQYTFFQYYENQGVLYRVPTSGAVTFPEEIIIQVQN
jgi:predicted thioredoxin/glutaredoxin